MSAIIGANGGTSGGGIPNGGTAGQSLIKNSAIDGDTAWGDAIAPNVGTPFLAGSQTSGGGTLTIVVTTTADIPAGALVWGACNNDDGGGSAVLTAVADPVNGAWTIDHGAANDCDLAHFANSAHLPVGTLITFTFSNAFTFNAMVFACAGMDSGGAQDAALVNVPLSGAPATQSAPIVTAAETTAPVLLVALIGLHSGATVTFPAGWTKIADTVPGSNNPSISAACLLVAAKEAQTLGVCLFSRTQYWSGLLASFKGT